METPNAQANASESVAMPNEITKNGVPEALDGDPDQQKQPEMQTPIVKANGPESGVMPDKITYLNVWEILDEEPDPQNRTFDKEFAERLAASIDVDGLLVPPIVEQCVNGYAVRDGRHRIYACREILRWPKIPCIVLTDVDADLREAIDLAANLFNKPLEDVQYRLALKRWHNLYVKRYPATTEKGRHRHREGFAKEIERVLGISQGHAQRLANTAKQLSELELNKLKDAGATPTEIDEVAALRDRRAIEDAAKARCDGVNHEEAIRRGKKVKAEKKAVAAKQPASSGSAAKPKSDRGRRLPAPSDLTDEEWLNENCANMLKLLRHRSAYKADAILYRRIQHVLIEFRGDTRKAMAEAKRTTGNGGFFGALSRLIRASHPSEWQVCGQCKGTGTMPTEQGDVAGGATHKQCDMCFGAAYRLKLEDL